MNDWSAQFNTLPDDVRTIGAALEAKVRIQMLNKEKERIKRRSAQSVREINLYIASCERFLREIETKPTTTTPRADIQDSHETDKP
jgi:hypothetical protein